MNKTFSKYFLFYPIVFLRNEPVKRYLNEYMVTQWNNKNHIQNEQFNKFLKLLNYVKRNAPFYKKNLADIPIHINSILDNKIPLLNKKDLINNKDDLVSSEKFIFYSKKSTGGSTGEPVTTLKDSTAMARERAGLWRGYSWSGIDIGDRQGRFWGVPLTIKGQINAKLIDIANNRQRISAFNISEKDLFRYYKELNRFKPKYLYGYVSLIRLFGRFLEDNNLKFSFELKSIITTAEQLTEKDRNEITRIYNCKVFNEYGSGEIGTIAHECDKGNLHINAENVYVEVLNENNELCQTNDVGEIVITELNNHMLPLIRYRIGDYGSLGSDECECGRGLPILKNVFGRAYDIVKAPDGKKFHPSFFNYIFKETKKKFTEIKQFQVVQLSEMELLINLVASQSNRNFFEKEISRMINRDIPDIHIKFRYVEAIQREKSGKLRLVKGLGNNN